MSTLILEVLKPFSVKHGGQILRREPGQRFYVTPEQARRVLDQVGDRVRVVDEMEAVDKLIGTAVLASQEFTNEEGEFVKERAPWIILDVDHRQRDPAFLPGLWLLLMHGGQWRWAHVSNTQPYRCARCQGSSAWWSEHTVLCGLCSHPSTPAWQVFWRELAELSLGIELGDIRYNPFVNAVLGCDEAFRLDDYPQFQMWLLRARRAVQVAKD